MHAHVKKAEELVPGDVLNLNGIGAPVRSVTMDAERDRVRIHLLGSPDFLGMGLEKSYPTGTQVEYVTAEEWEG